MATKKTTYREPDEYFPKEIRDKYFPNLKKKDTKGVKKTAPKKKTSK